MAPSSPPLVPRTPNSEYSPHKRTRIAVGYNLGLSRRALVAKEGVAYGSISKIVSRYKVQKSGISSPRSGRPKILQDRDIRKILRLIASNPFISSKRIKEEGGFQCSERTIKRELISLGIQHYTALRRPKLTLEVAKKRLTFALEHRGKPKE